MTALVHELTTMAGDRTATTADLLRKATVVAHRLSVPEIADWLRAELKGYPEGSDLPDYRRLVATVQTFPGEGGKKAIPSNQAESLDSLLQTAAKIDVRLSVSTIESLIHQGDKLFIYELPQAVHVATQRLGNFSMVRFVNRAQYQNILDIVRTGVLDWALDLEERGIIGEGMSFTKEEKQVVQELHYHISNVSGSQILIGSNGSTQTLSTSNETSIEALAGLVQALGKVLADVQSDAAVELRAELLALQELAQSPKPKWSIIKAIARSIKTTAEGAGGNILGNLAQPYMTTLLALAS